MDTKKLEKICSSICFRYINHKLIYPQKIGNMKYMIIYPTDGFYLTEKQYSSIFNVIKEQSENEYFISDIEFKDSFSKGEKSDDLGYMHRKHTSFSYDNYINETLLFEYAIYDVKGFWGISVFQDYYAIICGSEKLIESVRKNYSNVVDKQRFEELLQTPQYIDKAFKEKMTELISKSQ